MKVTDTAAIVAGVRAAESRLPADQRLFDDPFARLFARDLGSSEVAVQFLSAPFLREQVRLRTRFIDDFVRRGLADGARQIVVLGAGFDCRALRMPEIPASGSTVFEVDYAMQLETKRGTLEGAGVRIPEFVRFVACDFSADDFESSLSRALAVEGLRVGESMLFIWEGVVTYLEQSQIDRSLRWMAATGARGSKLVLNYAVSRLGSFGLDPDHLGERVTAAGFTTVEDHSFSEIHRRYLPGDPTEVAELFHIAIVTR